MVDISLDDEALGGLRIELRDVFVDSRRVLRRVNDSFNNMPSWLGALIAGTAAFLAMMALLAVEGDLHPLTGGAICGFGVGLISWTARRFKCS